MAVAALSEMKRTLVLENMHVADDYVRYHYQPNPTIAGFTKEDLRQVGYLALCDAAIRYDGSVKFVTYAQKVVASYLADYCRHMLSTVWIGSLDQPITEDSDYSGSQLLPDQRAERDFEEVEVRDLLDRCKRNYTGVERKGVEAIELKLCGYTDAEIAIRFGRKRNQVNAWISKARRKMREDQAVVSAMS